MGYCQGDGGDDDAAARFCFIGTQVEGVPGGVWHGEWAVPFLSVWILAVIVVALGLVFFLTAFARL